MQILSQDQKKWKAENESVTITSWEGKTTQPPCLFVAKKWPHVFLGLVSIQQQRWIPSTPPPQNPDKTQPRTKDYNLQRPQRQLPYPANFYLRTNAMWGEKNLDDAGGDLRTFKKEFKSPQRRNLLTFWIEGIYLLVAFWFPIGTYLFDWIWKLKKKTR